MNKNLIGEGINESCKNIFKEKLGEFTSLNINKINISEFNTRCQFIDNLHVKSLMDSIEKRGYIPKSAVWVNAVTDNGTKQGNIIQYRLVAGRHRYEACRRIEFKEIPCQLYYNLTDEEECELDRIDNELDEHHKPFHFLEEAEHYKYLRDVKGWSQRQIAEAKNVSRAIIQYRLKISELSSEIKLLFKVDNMLSTPPERHIIEVLKLTSIPHQILVCREMFGVKNDTELVTKITSGSEKFHKEWKNSNDISEHTKPMTQSEVEARVAQLLALEQQEKIAEKALPFVKEKSGLENTSVVSLKNDVDKNEGNNTEVREDGQSEQVFFEEYSYTAGNKVSDKPVATTNLKRASSSKKKGISDSKLNINSTMEHTTKLSAEQLEFEIFSMMLEKREDKGLRFGVTPLWLLHTNLIHEMCSSAYILLSKLISCDFRYKPDKDGFFFIKHGKSYENCAHFLAHIAGVKIQTLEKKVLPALEEYIIYMKNFENFKFQVKWDKIFEVYKKNAKNIPFDDGGLEDIPKDYTGWIKPTPYHSIYIENGFIKKYEEKKQEINNGKIVQVPAEPVKPIKENVQEISGKPVEKMQDKPVKSNPVPAVNPVVNNFSLEKKQDELIKPNSVSTNNSPLVIKLRGFGMVEEMINLCVNHKDIKDIIKYTEEQLRNNREKIQNIPGYIYKMVKDGFTPPEGFESAKEVEEKREKKRKAEEFGEKIKREFEAGRVKYFERDGKKCELSIIPDTNTFLYKNNKGMPVAGIFRENMDEKFFIG